MSTGSLSKNKQVLAVFTGGVVVTDGKVSTGVKKDLTVSR